MLALLLNVFTPMSFCVLLPAAPLADRGRVDRPWDYAQRSRCVDIQKVKNAGIAKAADDGHRPCRPVPV